MVSLTNRPNMPIAVYRGYKATAHTTLRANFFMCKTQFQSGFYVMGNKQKFTKVVYIC